MTTFKSFEDINVWKKARILAKIVFNVVSQSEFRMDYSLKNQMLKSSGSIMDNIAEGQARGGDNEFKQFLWIAKGSTAELRSQLYRCHDRQFIDQNIFEDLSSKSKEIEKMIVGLINHIKKSEIAGLKFK